MCGLDVEQGRVGLPGRPTQKPDATQLAAVHGWSTRGLPPGRGVNTLQYDFRYSAERKYASSSATTRSARCRCTSPRGSTRAPRRARAAPRPGARAPAAAGAVRHERAVDEAAVDDVHLVARRCRAAAAAVGVLEHLVKLLEIALNRRRARVRAAMPPAGVSLGAAGSSSPCAAASRRAAPRAVARATERGSRTSGPPRARRLDIVEERNRVRRRGMGGDAVRGGGGVAAARGCCFTSLAKAAIEGWTENSVEVGAARQLNLTPAPPNQWSRAPRSTTDSCFVEILLLTLPRTARKCLAWAPRRPPKTCSRQMSYYIRSAFEVKMKTVSLLLLFAHGVDGAAERDAF